jgi:hypothetical protein
VERLEQAVDELATAYPGTPRGEPLGRVRAYLGYVGTLLRPAHPGPGSNQPRTGRRDRAASARLDLSLALIASGRHDEAAGTALEAINSGRIMPSNYWRAREVIHAVADRGVPEPTELAEAYQEACSEGSARRCPDGSALSSP